MSEKMFQILTKEDNFFKMYKFTCQLPKEQGYMLSYLIDAESFVDVGLSDDSAFFECCKEGFIDKLLIGWSKYEISKALKGLQDSGYIFIRTINIDGKQSTYVKLNYDAINKLNTNYKKLNLEGKETLPSKVKKVNRIKNNYQEHISSTKVEDEVKKQETKEIKMTSKSFKEVWNYIESLEHSESFKETVRLWYDNVAKGRITPSQLKDKLGELYLECNKDITLMEESIKYCYLNNYFKWFNKNSSFKTSTKNSAKETTEHNDKITKEQNEENKKLGAF